MLQEQAASRSKSTCDWATIKALRTPRCRGKSVSSAALATFGFALPGLVRAGHGLATIGFCLGVNVEWILQQAVLHGLPTPSARPMRRPSGKASWTTEQIQMLVLLWPTNLYATCIAEKLGRTPASVRYKASWLGLARRKRAKLVRTVPDVPTLSLLNPASRGWTVDLGHKVGVRYISGQHVAGIARDVGRSFGAVNSYTCAIGLPRRQNSGNTLKMNYDETDPTLDQYKDWVYRPCNLQPAHWFWTSRHGDRTAPATKKSKEYKDLVASSNADGSDTDFADD